VKEVGRLTAVGGLASDRTSEGTADARKRATSALIDSHDAVFRRTARRYSICAEDAEDAYQRSLEILLTKAPTLESDALVRWMQVVTKRESLAVRRQRERLLSGGHSSRDEDDDRDPLDSIASDQASPTERAASRERVARSREALRALKPQEIRALMLKAQGYSYAEIGEITGWTHTKINRCMAEGRKRFLEVFADIEQGRRCEELATALSALADGERDVIGAEDVSVHLRTCGSCRAKLRAFRAIPDRVLELMPTGPAVDMSIGGRAHEWVGERVGGAVDKLREGAYSIAHRGGASEGEAAAGLAGGLQTSAAKALAICGVAVAGTGGAYCAVNDVNPGDLIAGQTEQVQIVEEPDPITPIRPPELAEMPLPPPSAPEQTAEAVMSEEPLSQAQQTSKELGFEQVAPAGGSSSGGEFGAPVGRGSGGDSSGGGGGGFGFEE
jgi:RNA polymerase sigma factor (sigma-70 family)